MNETKVTKILNSKGEPIVLNAMEARVALHNEKIVNALGYEIDITSLTAIQKKVTEQKFFQIAPAEYVPVSVGNGAWSTQLTTYRSYSVGDDFSTGVINTGKENARLASVRTGIDAVNVKVLNWAKAIGYTLFDLQFASKSGNWDMVAALEKGRKKNWDLGIQQVAFLGLSGDSSALGLYNQSGITANTALITKAISSMTPVELNALLAGLIQAYRTNCLQTAWPTTFVVPESDYNGLATMYSPTYPMRTILDVLTSSLKLITRNPSFEVLPCAYGDNANSGLGVQRYVLLNKDEESIRMDIPVDYTATLANSIDSFSYNNVGYGQFTGVQAYRPLELLYLQY